MILYLVPHCSIVFLKSPRPSLPLKRAPPLTPTLSPSGEREETAPPRRSEPLRSKVGGPSQVFAMVVRDGTAWGREFTIYNLQLIVSYLYLGGFEGNWLITCRFSAFSLVVSIKKRTFAEKFNV